jgi:hypothetical protein
MSGDDTRLGGFEERLLAELRGLVVDRGSDVEHRSSGHRGRRLVRPRWRYAVAVGVAALVAGIGMTGLLSRYGDGTPAAYAVTRNANGSVTVEVRSLRDAAGLQRALRADGVPAVVFYAPPGKTCQHGWVHNVRMSGRFATRVGGRDGVVRFTIQPRIPPGDTLVITTSGTRSKGPHHTVFGALSIGLASGPVGACKLVNAAHEGHTHPTTGRGGAS